MPSTEPGSVVTFGGDRRAAGDAVHGVASRALMVKLHGLAPAAVKTVEDEGVVNDRPPLGE
jgi:hypothetical protein